MFPIALMLMAQAVAPLTLEEAERLALDRSPDLKAAAAAAEGALADQRSQRGALLPRLHADGNLQYWGTPYSVNFLSELPTQLTQLLPAGTNLSTTVRDSFTSTLSLTLSQPLTQLWGLWRLLDSQRLAHEAALAHLDATGRDLLFQVRQSYFRLLQAVGNAGIADESVRELESHVQVAREQFEAGTLVKADLLRSQVQLGQARQDLVKAKAAVLQLQATLDALLGQPADQPVTPLDPFVDVALPEPHESLAELTDEALLARPDLRGLALRRDQAATQVDAAWSQLVPGVAAEGQYQVQSGQLFLAPSQAFVGASLSWDIWDWGNKYYAVKSAQARVAQGEQALRAAQLKLRSQVQNALQDLLADRDGLKVAAEVVEQAQESFRLETERYRAQAATSTDLLDAQAALGQSKLRLSNARYDYLTALSQLEDLVGQPLLGR